MLIISYYKLVLHVALAQINYTVMTTVCLSFSFNNAVLSTHVCIQRLHVSDIFSKYNTNFNNDL